MLAVKAKAAEKDVLVKTKKEKGKDTATKENNGDEDDVAIISEKKAPKDTVARSLSSM